MGIGFVNPPVRLGVVTDIQYANKPDRSLRSSEEKQASTPVVERIRRYSRVLDKTQYAVEKLNSENVVATVHLGDIIDGNLSKDDTHQELKAVIEALSPLNAPVFHVLGNHCLAAGRPHLMSSLGLKEGYYYRDLSPKWRLVVLDTVDVSVDREEGHEHRKLAKQYLQEHEGEVNANDWNGAVGAGQMEWLKIILHQAADKGMFVIACGHHPIMDECAEARHTVWNNTELKRLLRDHKSVVKAYFAGHYHEGGYVVADGVHHVTFEAILDSQSEDGSWGVVELHEDRIVVHGHGEMTSRELQFE